MTQLVDETFKICGVHFGVGDILKQMRMRGTWAEALNALGQRERIHAYAKQQGVTTSDAELQGAMDAYRKLNGLHRADVTEQWLAHSGLTLEEVEHDREAVLLEKKLLQTIPTELVTRHFEEHRSELDQARLRVIVCDSEAKAKELYQQILEDEADFSALALEHSEDAETAPRGGAAGWTRRAALNDEVAARVFAAQPGDVVGPIVSDGGVELFLVDELKPAELTGEVELEIRETLLEKQLQEFANSFGS